MRKILAAAFLLITTTICSGQVSFPWPGIVSGTRTYGTITLPGGGNSTLGGSLGTTSTTATYSTAPTGTNDILVCATTVENTSATVTLSDTMTDGGGAWTVAIGPITDNTNTVANSYIYWRRLGTSANSVATVTATESGTGHPIYLGCTQYHASSGTFQLDGTPTTVSGNGAGGTWTLSNITTNSTSGLIVVFANTINNTVAAGSYTRWARNGGGTYVRAMFDAVFTAGSNSTAQTLDPSAPATWQALAVSFAAY